VLASGVLKSLLCELTPLAIASASGPRIAIERCDTLGLPGDRTSGEEGFVAEPRTYEAITGGDSAPAGPASEFPCGASVRDVSVYEAVAALAVLAAGLPLTSMRTTDEGGESSGSRPLGCTGMVLLSCALCLRSLARLAGLTVKSKPPLTARLRSVVATVILRGSTTRR
jgi:hypothetical protein